ncbi:phosphoglycerate kinase [Patescibacteria group bacterium]|nr:phosphoglycerate kinase [Patescibacteria group bacterium]
MPIKSIKKLKNLRGKRVLIRVDFNVPLRKGKVREEHKIEKSLPTITHFLREGAKVILVSHLGRPKDSERSLSLKSIVSPLQALLQKQPVFLGGKKFDKIYWKRARKMVEEMQESDVLLLENVRFFKGEKDNNPEVAKGLASLADIFVLDGFAVAHRDSSSVTGVAKLLPSYAGLLLLDEIEGLSKVLKPEKPLVIVLAGIKIETKIPVLKKLLPKADNILIGGGIFNTYLKSKGRHIGSSIVDNDVEKSLLVYLDKKKVIKPVDVVVGRADGKKARVWKVDESLNLNDKKLGIYDIGPETVKMYAKYIKKAKTIVWNGAMGHYEVYPYQFGTHAIARLFASHAMGKAYGVCGGGETVEVLKKLKLMNDIDLVSTGGGAMLEFLSGKNLPGIKALKNN